MIERADPLTKELIDGATLLYTQPNGMKCYDIPLGPIARKHWPLWIKIFADAYASDTDKGFGDTVARVLGDPLSTAVKKLAALAGKECGCQKRRETWNLLYPYHVKEVG